MRGEYTLKPPTYEIDRRGVQLVDLVGYPLAKHMGKYRAHSKVSSTCGWVVVAS